MCKGNCFGRQYHP